MPLRNALRFIVVFLALVAPAASHAQLFRAYLASNGLDSNPCTLAAPCRLLPAALAAVTNGGEIWMLDSANFNTSTVDIAKSVNILAIPGAVGSLVANGGPALTVSTAGLAVALRNIVVVQFPGSASASGIYMTVASNLTIDQSLFSGLAYGVFATGGSVKVFDSLFRSNFGAIRLTNASGEVTGEVAGTKMTDNVTGILAQGLGAGSNTVSITDCILSMGSGMGIQAAAHHPSALVRIWVSRTTVRGFSHALHASTTDGMASIDVSGSTVVGNSNQHYVGGASSTVRSRGNNHFADNVTSFGTIISSPLQ